MNDQVSNNPEAKSEAARLGKDIAEGKPPVVASFDVKAVAREEFLRTLHPLFASKISFEEAWTAIAGGSHKHGSVPFAAMTEGEYRNFVKWIVRGVNAKQFVALAQREAAHSTALSRVTFDDMAARLACDTDKVVLAIDGERGTVFLCSECPKGDGAPEPSATIVVDLANGASRPD